MAAKTFFHQGVAPDGALHKPRRSFRSTIANCFYNAGVVLIFTCLAVSIIGFTTDDVDLSAKIISADQRSCLPSPDNNWCAPKNSPPVVAEIGHNESLVRTCTGTPRLATFVIFQFRDDERAPTVGFDEAIGLGENDKGWVQAYCD